jgi:hypothetical protein
MFNPLHILDYTRSHMIEEIMHLTRSNRPYRFRRHLERMEFGRLSAVLERLRNL